MFFKLGISGRTSVSRAKVQFPIKKINLEFNTHIIDDDLPLLFSLAEIDRLDVYFNNLSNQLVNNPSGETAS